MNLKTRKKAGDDSYKLGDIIGKFGLEKYYDKYLRGIPGGEQVEVDVTGRPVQRLGMKNPVSGASLTLTIDHNLQEATEKAMDEVMYWHQCAGCCRCSFKSSNWRSISYG